MKKYYPIILSKMMWAYRQITNILVGIIDNRKTIEDITKFAGLAIRIYPNDAKFEHDPPTSLEEIRITKRLIKIINNYFLKCLKESQLDSDDFRQCKRLINDYIADQLKRLKS